MKIRLFSVLLVFCFLYYSCNNKGGNKQAESGEIVKVTFDSLIANPENYIGKTLAVEGKVVFVCPSCGKKLKITGNDPDANLVVEAGELIPKFSTDLIGSTIEVEGMIVKSGAVTAEEEHCSKADTCSKNVYTEACDSTEKAVANQTALSGIIMDYRSHVVR
jgi:fructose-specific component phosphotransferase system IIB-like protein